jgi:cytochrome c oxidase subunit 2
MWKTYQPNGREEIDALHIPVGVPIKLVMTSQDVIHSFYIPDFRVKQDVLPERYTTMWFTATKPGRYRIRCAQYCGTDHSVMTGWVEAMVPADYQQWLDAAPALEPTVNGTPGTPIAPMATGINGIFSSAGCIACHVPNSSVRAPRLDGIFDRPVRLVNGQTVSGDEQYIRESILFPNAKISAGYPQPSLMPSYNGQLTEPQLRELVSFIKSIRDGWPAGATSQPVDTAPAKGKNPS